MVLGGIVPLDYLHRPAGRRHGYCLGLTPSQARYLLSQRTTHSASCLGELSSASTWREPVVRLRMLSASSGRDQSKKSLATTIATARPKQTAGARVGEPSTRRGILRSGTARWSRNRIRRECNVEQMKTRERKDGRGKGRGGRNPTRTAAHPPEAEGRGGPKRRRERGPRPATRAPHEG